MTHVHGQPMWIAVVRLLSYLGMIAGLITAFWSFSIGSTIFFIGLGARILIGKRKK